MMDHDEYEYLKEQWDREAFEYDELVFGLGLPEEKPKKMKVNKQKNKVATKKKGLKIKKKR